MIDSTSGEAAYRQVARELERRIHARAEGYGPGWVLPAAEHMAREMSLGVDAIRDAYQLLAAMGLVTLRRGYGAQVRTEREREVIIVPPGTTVLARMPTFAETDRWSMEQGVPMLVAGEEAWPADRYEVQVAKED